MALKGQAKSDYQRGYMRRWRAKKGLLDQGENPNVGSNIVAKMGFEPNINRPVDADGVEIPDYD